VYAEFLRCIAVQPSDKLVNPVVVIEVFGCNSGKLVAEDAIFMFSGKVVRHYPVGTPASKDSEIVDG